MPNPNSPAGDNDTTSTVTNDQQGVVAGANPDAKDDAALTSTAAAEGAKEPELDLEAIVRKAVEKEQPGAEVTPANGKESEGDEPAPTGDQPTDAEKAEADRVAQEAEDAKLPFHKHPRWQEKLRKERELTEQVTTFQTQVAELKPKAEQFDRIGSFMREAELTAEEVSRGFDIMATMKRDPLKALEMLAPHLEGLELVTGKRLPPDLQKKVDSEGMSQADAQEIARARVDAALAQGQVQHVQQQAEAERARAEQEASQKLGVAMRTAVVDWENSVKERDPDYPKLQSFINDRARVLAQANRPKSPDDAIAIVKQAYDEVKAQSRKLLPAKTATRTVTSDTSSTKAVPAPSSMLDIVKQSLGR